MNQMCGCEDLFDVCGKEASFVKISCAVLKMMVGRELFGGGADIVGILFLAPRFCTSFFHTCSATNSRTPVDKIYISNLAPCCERTNACHKSESRYTKCGA